MLEGPITLASRVTVTRPAEQLLTTPLPMVCAVSGLAATEMLPARMRVRHAPLWLLLLGIVPYVVVRILLGSGGPSLTIQLPYARAVADRLALLQTAQIAGWCLFVVALVVAQVVNHGEIAILGVVAAVLAVLAGGLASALQVKPVLRDGLVQMRISRQLAAAIGKPVAAESR